MAAILEGSTSHQSYAPLSQRQTLAIAKHLSEQIEELKMQVSGLQDTCGGSGDVVKNLQEGLSKTNMSLRDLQDGHDKLSTVVDSQKKDLGRTNARVTKLHTGLQTAMEKVEGLQEAATISSTNFKAMMSSLAQTTATAHAVREDVELRIGTKFEKLQDMVGRLDHDLASLREYDELDKVAAQEQKQEMRATNAVVQAVKDDLAKTNTVCQMFEQRLSDAAQSLKETRSGSEACNNMVLVLKEDHEATKSDVTEVRDSARRVGTKAKQVNDGLENMVAEARALQCRLNTACKDLSTARQQLTTTQSTVQGLQEGQQMMSVKMQGLQMKLGEVQQVSQATANTVKETNSILLPNLFLDESGPLASRGGIEALGFNITLPGAAASKGFARKQPQSARGKSVPDMGSKRSNIDAFA